jgi:uncharacterized protein YecT (DUF1311 family)
MKLVAAVAISLSMLLLGGNTWGAEETQIDINQKAADQAQQAEKKVDAEIKALAAKFSTVKGIRAKLDESQELWKNFCQAHMSAIYPLARGEDYRVVYGSIFGLCAGNYRKAMAEERLAELHSLTAPATRQSEAEARAEYEKADKVLNETYARVMRGPGKTNQQFRKNLIKAEVTWIALRNIESEIRMLVAIEPQTRYEKMTELTNQRIKQLNKWLSGVEEGDPCSGTYPVK